MKKFIIYFTSGAKDEVMAGNKISAVIKCYFRNKGSFGNIVEFAIYFRKVAVADDGE